jgi:hypothetical protein
MNAANQTVPIDKMSAMAMAGPRAETHVPLERAGDHFIGKLAVPKAGSTLVNVMVASGEQNFEGSFVVSEKGVAVQ